jgi:DNA adenine methylase
MSYRPGYIGGKGQDGVYQRIIGQMPPHSVYVEAFAGSAAVFHHKRPAAQNLLIDKSPAAIARLGEPAGATVLCGDAVALLPALALPAEAVVYCDPPYLLETRQNRLYYAEEMSDQEHRQLLEVLRGLKCRVLLSGYPSELYGAALRDWRCLSYRCRTRQKTVTECLWMNFPEPDALHDWRYAGRNFRERLALRRLATRWLARLQAMPPRKRGYVLHALADPHTGSDAGGHHRRE